MTESGRNRDRKMAKSERDVDWRAERKKLVPLFFAQTFLALVLVFITLYGGYHYCPSLPVPKSNDFSDKLIYALRVCAFPAVMTLLVAVLMVSRKRVNGPGHNPLAGKESYLQLDKNVLTNTVEQVLVFLLFVLVLITYLQPAEMRIIPLYSIIFVVSRVLFRIGYGIHPKYRSCGMLTLFLSHFIIAGFIMYMMYTRGFMYNLVTATFGDIETQANVGKSEL